MKSNIAKISDRIFLTAAVWILTAYALGYFMADIFLKIIVSTAVTLLILLLIKNKKEPTDYSALKEYAFISKDEQLALVCQKLKSRYPAAEVKNGLITTSAAALALKLDGEKVSLNEIVEKLSEAKKLNITKIIFLSPCGYTVGAEEAVLRSDITVIFWGEKECFDFLQAFDALLAKPKKNKPKKLNLLLKKALNRNKIKGYSLTACLMLFMAYFNAFSIYYAVIAAVCVCLAIMSVINLPNLIDEKKRN